MSRIIHWLREEMTRAIPAIIFFAFSFNLINLTEKLMLRPYDFDYVSCLTATIAALLVGKLIIIVNMFPFINLFPEKPLIWNVSWKIVVYSLAACFFKSLDGFIHFYFQYDDVHFAWLALQGRWYTSIFWAVQLWLLMLFAVYVSFSELVGKIGADKVKVIFFGK